MTFARLSRRMCLWPPTHHRSTISSRPLLQAVVRLAQATALVIFCITQISAVKTMRENSRKRTRKYFGQSVRANCESASKAPATRIFITRLPPVDRRPVRAASGRANTPPTESAPAASRFSPRGTERRGGPTAATRDSSGPRGPNGLARSPRRPVATDTGRGREG